ncbi:hypothetical protein Tco_1067866 [Tanacetum coccineum]|uniref:Uncharacterized protein n=1 Tax=Tanacetum coccineum TaxID=301880 RepID=A0ABQ5HEZ3_9ASTR
MRMPYVAKNANALVIRCDSSPLWYGCDNLPLWHGCDSLPPWHECDTLPSWQEYDHIMIKDVASKDDDDDVISILSLELRCSCDEGIIMAEGEIDNLTMEQYIALTRGNQAPGVVKPEIVGNVNFKIRSQFMRELREDTFSENKNDDAHEHVERVLDIVSLFNIPGVSHDAFMLRVFPITLTRAAKRWVDRLSPGTVNS